MSPSFEGTLALSFTDCVWTDIFCTDFNGLTRWIPSGRVSPVTRPNRVSTPTFPVGIELVLAINRMITSTTIAICNNFFPAPPKLGIPGIPPPPSSNLVVVGIFPSVLRLLRTRIEPHHPHFSIRKESLPNFLAVPRPRPFSSRSLFRQSLVTIHQSPLPATLPQYLV